MSWPKNPIENVPCVGFSKTLLPGIMRAINAKRVEWVRGSTEEFAGSFAADFIYKGMRFTLEEFYEEVQFIKYVSGELVP